MTEQYIVFSVNGGIGKNIAATAVVARLKREFPSRQIIILTAWKDVWMLNPDVHRSYNFNNAPFFYSNYIQNKDTLVFALDPYQSEGYILKKEHLIQSWMKTCQLSIENPAINLKPVLYFNAREKEFVKNQMWRNDPILLIQTNGGGPSEQKFSWMRDMPIDVAKKVVNHFKGQMRIVHVRRDDQLSLAGTEQFKGSIRELMLLIAYSSKRLFIDSMCQHAAAALEKKSTVLWIGNDPAILGYDIHDNFTPKEKAVFSTLDYSVLEPYDISGLNIQCPYDSSQELFDVSLIIKSLENQ